MKPPSYSLSFADDALLFAKDKPADICELLSILNKFTSSSGQKINLTKSRIIFGQKVNNANRASIAAITSILVWNNPRVYLGIPAKWGGSKVQSLQWLKDLILNKMNGWKGNLLNPAGREILIKSVVQAIPSYIISILKLPKTFCNALSAEVARFWWSSNGDSRGIHWKKREVIYSPKSFGGLGFKDFEDLNKSFLAKQAWRLINEPTSYWAETLKGIYFPNRTFWSASKQRGSSWVWQSLLQWRQLL